MENDGVVVVGCIFGAVLGVLIGLSLGNRDRLTQIQQHEYQIQQRLDVQWRVLAGDCEAGK